MCKISETLVIDYDSATDTDKAVLSVCRFDGSKITQVNTFTGDEATWMYDKLKRGVTK